MSTSVTMPALGESVSEGTVTRWLKQEGDQVAVDEPLLEVSTDKVDTEIPSPAAGVLTKIVVAEDETVAVGAELAVIGDAAEGAGGRRRLRQQEQEAAGGAAAAGAGRAAAASSRSRSRPSSRSRAGAARSRSSSPSSRSRRRRSSRPRRRRRPGGDSSGGGTSVTMPALGESVTEGTVTRWLKQEGDQVAVDEPLLEVSTDKVDTEIPSPAAGVLTKIVVAEDETVAVGAELAVIGGGSGSAQPDAGAPAAGGSSRQQEPPAAGRAAAARPRCSRRHRRSRHSAPAPAQQSAPRTGPAGSPGRGGRAAAVHRARRPGPARPAAGRPGGRRAAATRRT